MDNHVAVLRPDGALTEAAVLLLHAVTRVDEQLLRAVRIRPSRRNWLRAPWYAYRRGGAITVGRTIWFTGIWFHAEGRGDGSPSSTMHWLLHLAHEVGHLPQAERFGHSLPGKLRYVTAFAGQYIKRAVLFRWPVHDGSPLEREAELGRQTLLHLLGGERENHPMVQAVHHQDARLVAEWARREYRHLASLAQAARESLSA